MRQLCSSGAGSSAVEHADFAAAAERCRRDINAWISGETRGRVPKLLSAGAVNSDTRLVIAAACCFKAEWRHPLTPGADLHFRTAAGQTQTVRALELSSSDAEKFACVRTDTYSAVRLPYADIDAAMVLIKPHSSLRDVRGQLTGQALLTLLRDAASAPLRLRMPRFKIEQSHSVDAALQQLGALRMFDRTRADFSNLTQASEAVCVGAVQHQAWVAVDERGTEAGGAAAVVMTRMGRKPLPVQPFELALDAPFIFVIQCASTGEP